MKRERAALPVLSVFMAVALTIVPLPERVAAAWPFWVALVMIYWQLESPHMRNLGSAFAAGLVLDLATGSLLGQHALRLVILAFLVARFRNRIRFFPPWQQALAIGALLFNDRIVQLWIIGILQLGWPSWSWWLPPLTGMLVWPWLFLLLDALRWRRGVSR